MELSLLDAVGLTFVGSIYFFLQYKLEIPYADRKSPSTLQKKVACRTAAIKTFTVSAVVAVIIIFKMVA